MYAELTAAVASAKSALDIAKAAHGLSNYNQLVSAVSEVNAKLMEATTVALASLEKQSALTSEIADLKEKLRDAEDWKSTMERYRLHEFPTKALAYAVKPGMEHGEPSHYLCASCVGNNHKSILQPNGHFLECPVCTSSIKISHTKPRASSPKTDSWKTK